MHDRLGAHLFEFPKKGIRIFLKLDTKQEKVPWLSNRILETFAPLYSRYSSKDFVFKLCIQKAKKYMYANKHSSSS